MTREQFDKKRETVEIETRRLSELEHTLQEMIETEHAQTVRAELMAARHTVHAARLNMVVVTQRLREAFARTTG